MLYRIDLNEPHTVYNNAAGKRLPGVTTVLGVLNKPALLNWAAAEERAGVLAAVKSGEPLPDSYFCNIKRDRAADLGTVTHARCEAFLKGMELDESNLDAGLVEKSMNGAIRFMDSWKEGRLTLVHSELVMVSEALQCGGTADVVARTPAGSLVLKDLKTSKASKWWPYGEVFGQVSAYAAMYEEIHGERIDRIEVERIGKEEGDPGQTYTLNSDERAAGLNLFTSALGCYRALKEIGR